MPTPGFVSLGRRSPVGLTRSLSAVAWSLDPGPDARDGPTAATIGELRRARALGITTFDLGTARVPGIAEIALGRAFPERDPEIVTILPLSTRRLAPSVAARDGASLDETVRAALSASAERLAGAGQIVVEWQADSPDPARPDRAFEALESLRREGHLVGVATERLPRPAQEREGPSRPPGLRAGSFSLLQPGLATAPDGPAGTTTPSWIARDVLAGGRLDGTAFSLPSPRLRGGTPPSSIRALESEFEPVRRLAFLTSGGRRTLAQAALRFVLAWPWVATASIPVPAPERLDEIARAGESPPLSPEEVARVLAATGPPETDRRGSG